jgi:adenosyl cobinamide kinase/adenosyl cobinamide phosphate guanylyltransferase
MPTSIENEQIRLTSQVRHRAVGDEGVLVHLENGRVLVVNEVGLFIVQQLESVQNRHALAGKIQQNLKCLSSRHFQIWTNICRNLKKRMFWKLPRSRTPQPLDVSDNHSPQGT